LIDIGLDAGIQDGEVKLEEDHSYLKGNQIGKCT